MKGGADVTVAVTSIPIEEAHRFGVVNTDDTNRIQGFTEKPRIPQSNLASMGIYVFWREALVRRLKEDALDSSSSHDFGEAVVPRMVKVDKVHAYKFDGYWRDVGTVESYYQANIELVSKSPPFSLDAAWPIFARQEAPSAVTESGLIGNSIISSGCIIRGRLQDSVLSAGVRIEPEAAVRESVVMANCVIGRGSVVDRCILDEEVTIGECSYVGFGASPMPGNWDVTVVGRGATIPPRTAIGRNCKICPGVGAADFRTSVAPAGTVVSRR